MRMRPIVVFGFIALINAGCGPPVSVEVGVQAGKRSPQAAQPPAPVLESRPDPKPPPPERSKSEPVLLHIDPKMRAKLDALDGVAGLPVAVCDEADARPLDCGLAEVCGELGRRWARQLTREFGEMPSMIEDVERLRYPESCAKQREPSTSADFTAHAVVVRHNVAGNLVGGLFTHDGQRWRGRARLIEYAVSGMALRIEHHPVAAWELDVDRQPGRELIVLVRGAEHGHAADLDPTTRARLLICGTAPRTSAEQGPWCGRVELGAWTDELSGRDEGAGWLAQVDIFANELVLSADAPEHSRTLTLAELDRADLRLIPAPGRRR